MRKKVIIGLVLLNVALAAALASPATAAKLFPFGIVNCCQEGPGGDEFCCINCCWFESNCRTSADCGPGAPGGSQ